MLPKDVSTLMEKILKLLGRTGGEDSVISSEVADAIMEKVLQQLDQGKVEATKIVPGEKRK
jgi:hypothetical protein